MYSKRGVCIDHFDLHSEAPARALVVDLSCYQKTKSSSSYTSHKSPFVQSIVGPNPAASPLCMSPIDNLAEVSFLPIFRLNILLCMVGRGFVHPVFVLVRSKFISILHLRLLISSDVYFANFSQW